MAFTLRRLALTSQPEHVRLQQPGRGGAELWCKVQEAVAGGRLRRAMMTPAVDAEEAVRTWECAYAGQSDYY